MVNFGEKIFQFFLSTASLLSFFHKMQQCFQISGSYLLGVVGSDLIRATQTAYYTPGPLGVAPCEK